MAAARPVGPAGFGPRAAVTAIAAFTGVLVVFPIGRLIQTAVTEGGDDLDRVLASPGLGTAVANTVVLAVAVTAVSVPAGVLTALGLRRPDLPARSFWRVAVLLPLLVPPYVLGYSWTQAYGRAGFTDSILGIDWPSVLGPVGVFVVLVVNAVPLTYLLVAVGLAARAEPDQERAARASGAGSLTVLATITLPLLRPALAAASILVFVLTLETFAVPQVMGTPAGFTTVTTKIYADLSLGGDPFSFVEAVTLALFLVVCAAVVVLPADAVLGPRLRTERAAAPEGAPIAPTRTTGSRWAAAGFGCYVLLGIALPLVALAAAAITRAVGLPPRPDNWTLENFSRVLGPRTFEALGHTLVLAVTAASLLTVLGTCLAVLERRRSGRWAAGLVTLPLVLPGSTLAVALLISYGRWLGGGLTLILLAYLAKLWAFAHRPISGALDRLPPEELYAARASGATAMTAARTVALRPLTPALLVGWLICFVTAMHEVTMSSLLYGPGSETLSVVVLNSQQLGAIGATAALALFITLLTVLPAVPLWFALRGLRTPQAHVG